ncbi:unnamed protein product [Schistocephalus solidus]|uniref:Uncharacterized protein n=1 Tax=Schistocephalus solidus TaxID=70667 RepID=A0A183T534_SCHSO|nr:unnamed protein product [Schistocephalus solidus]
MWLLWHSYSVGSEPGVVIRPEAAPAAPATCALCHLQSSGLCHDTRLRKLVDDGVGDLGVVVPDSSEVLYPALQNIRFLRRECCSFGAEHRGGFFGADTSPSAMRFSATISTDRCSAGASRQRLMLNPSSSREVPGQAGPLKLGEVLRWIDFDEDVLCGTTELKADTFIDCERWNGECVVVPSECVRVLRNKLEIADYLTKRPRAELLEDYISQFPTELCLKSWCLGRKRLWASHLSAPGPNSGLFDSFLAPAQVNMETESAVAAAQI